MPGGGAPRGTFPYWYRCLHGSLCVPQRQRRLRVLFPPRDVDEEPRLEVRHHHIRQVRDHYVCQVRQAFFRIPLPSISPLYLYSLFGKNTFLPGQWSYLLFNSPGRSTSPAFACTVDSLRCWNQAGRGETIPTSCSSGLFQREIHRKEKLCSGQVWRTEAGPREDG